MDSTLANLLRVKDLQGDRPIQGTQTHQQPTNNELTIGQQPTNSNTPQNEPFTPQNTTNRPPRADSLVIDERISNPVENKVELSLLDKLIGKSVEVTSPVLQAEESHTSSDLLSNLLNKKETLLDSEQVSPEVKESESHLFSPLRYPERLTVFTVTEPDGHKSEFKIDDELQLRRYIATSIESLTDEQLKAKIGLYQRLGVYIRICESEVTRVGQKWNKKFLEPGDDEGRFQTEVKESKPSNPRVSAEEKWIAKLMKNGLSRAKAKGLWDLKEGKASAESIKVSESLRDN
jgi:hypothetical protein